MHSKPHTQESPFLSYVRTAELLSKLIATEEPAEMAQVIAEQLRQVTGAKTAVLFRYSNETIPCNLLHTEPRRRSGLFEKEDLDILCPDKHPDALPFFVEDLPPEYPLRKRLQAAGVKNLQRFPLYAGGSLMGTCILLDVATENHVAEIDQMMAFLCPLIGLAIQNCYAQKQIREHSENLEYEIFRQTEELVRANETLDEARLAALNMMEDAVLAKESLAQSEARFRKLIEHLPGAVFVHDIEGRFTLVNEAACRNTGYTPDEFMNMAVKDVDPDAEKRRDPENIWRNLQDMDTTAIESRHRRKDGTFFPVDVYISAITLENAPRFLAVVFDVSKRKQAEIERERLLAAIEQAGEAIVVTDPEVNIVYVNPAFERITGYVLSEVQGKNPRLLQSGRQDEEFYKDMWNTLGRGETWHGHITNRKKDGDLYTESAVISPVLDADGNPQNYVAVKRDITSELDLQEQLRQSQKLDAIGKLAGGIAHDFNNLLMGILNYVDLCRDEISEDHKIRDWLDEISVDAQRSADLTHQLLAFARRQTAAPKLLDLSDAIAGMLRMLQRLIGEDIDFIWKPGPASCMVRIDPSQLDQILTNLCVNARDAIDGAGTITVSTRTAVIDETYCRAIPQAQLGRYAVLSVKDDGCGMDESMLAQIFEPFFTTKEAGKGTGLGLSTTYGVVRQNDGFIHVESGLGRGTTFRIYLPLQEDLPVSKPMAVSDKVMGGKECILLVEDEKSVRVTTSLFLEGLGYDVHTAETPNEAVAFVEESGKHIDLLMTDVVMPGMSGPALAAKLREKIGGLKCLFMSGYTADAMARSGIVDEDIHILTKPFSRDKMAQEVRAALGG